VWSSGRKVRGHLAADSGPRDVPSPSRDQILPLLAAPPRPNKAHAAWGRRAHRLEPDPATAPVVAWIFAQRLAGHSIARITRALNDAGIPGPSAADPKRNPHRTGAAWTLGTVASILANPRYTGRQVWNMPKFTRSWGITVSEGDLNPLPSAISSNRGNHTEMVPG